MLCARLMQLVLPAGAFKNDRNQNYRHSSSALQDFGRNLSKIQAIFSIAPRPLYDFGLPDEPSGRHFEYRQRAKGGQTAFNDVSWQPFILLRGGIRRSFL